MPNKPLTPVIATDAITGTETRYPPVKAAAAAIGIKPAQISTACMLGGNRHGHYWRKEEHDADKHNK
ncbi:hypothetical protein OBV_25270 [Oscillibacter valericigenes Sjm18-20]|nr:hypothetical protein OBV_25270 [Oscillibacter valericigenes Sjm18-20]